MDESEYQRMIRNASKSTKLRNLHAVLPPPSIIPPDDVSNKAMQELLANGIRLSTDEAKLNKTEAAYWGWLQMQNDLWRGVQCITLKLGHDCRLTPDFWALDSAGLRAIDTKGTNRKTNTPLVEEDAMIKMRLAARLFPFIHFVIAWKVGGVWEHRPVKS